MTAHRHVLVNLWSIYVDMHTLRYTLSANAATAHRGEMHYGTPSCPKSAEVTSVHFWQTWILGSWQC